jgi:hypothetical protein
MITRAWQSREPILFLVAAITSRGDMVFESVSERPCEGCGKDMEGQARLWLDFPVKMMVVEWNRECGLRSPAPVSWISTTLGDKELQSERGSEVVTKSILTGVRRHCCHCVAVAEWRRHEAELTPKLK